MSGSQASEGARLTPDGAAALLQWYLDAGVDAFIGEAPRDRFAETAAETETRRRPAPERSVSANEAARSSRDAPPVAAPISRAGSASLAPPRVEPGADGRFPAFLAALPDELAAADARERARSAATLDELRQALAAFEGCNLRVTAKSLVFGDGDPDADLMLIGEAPGREEDIAGVPFVGRSGQLLNRMLAAIGLARASVRVTNTVPWRPPGNRTPTPLETEACLPFLLRQVELVRPKMIVCLGSPAAKAILRSEEGIMRLRGRWQTIETPDGLRIEASAMLHPAYLLRQPGQKRLAWRDLLALRQRLDAS